MSQYIEQYLSEVQYAGGLNTQKPVSMESTLAVTGVATFTAAPVFTAAPTGPKTTSILASSGNTTITAATSGSTRLFDSSAGITYTLPAPVVGLTYTFLWTVAQASSNHIIITDAGTTFLLGGVVTFSGENVTPSATLGPKAFAADGSTHIKYTSNATTTGSGLGTWLVFTCVTATKWLVHGIVNSPSGTIATPFST